MLVRLIYVYLFAQILFVGWHCALHLAPRPLQMQRLVLQAVLQLHGSTAAVASCCTVVRSSVAVAFCCTAACSCGAAPSNASGCAVKTKVAFS